MRSFVGIPTFAYFGNLYDLPVKTSNALFGQQPRLPPTTVATQFVWTNYGAGTAQSNVAATVQMQTTGPRQLLDKILSVRIDNLGNGVPVYVYFPDTNYTVVAPPNTVVWEKVETAQFSALVIGEGFTDNTVGSTAVYFCNFEVQPFIDYEFPQTTQLWLASSTITRGTSIYNQNFGVPALGDQTTSYLNALTSAVGVFENNLWGTPLSSGFIYLTHINVYVISGPQTISELFWVLESAGTAGILYNFQGWCPAAGIATPYNLLSMSAMNVKIDATQTWRLRSSIIPTGGSTLVTHVFNWTTNPN